MVTAHAMHGTGCAVHAKPPPAVYPHTQCSWAAAEPHPAQPKVADRQDVPHSLPLPAHLFLHLLHCALLTVWRPAHRYPEQQQDANRDIYGIWTVLRPGQQSLIPRRRVAALADSSAGESISVVKPAGRVTTWQAA